MPLSLPVKGRNGVLEVGSSHLVIYLLFPKEKCIHTYIHFLKNFSHSKSLQLKKLSAEKMISLVPHLFKRYVTGNSKKSKSYVIKQCVNVYVIHGKVANFTYVANFRFLTLPVIKNFMCFDFDVNLRWENQMLYINHREHVTSFLGPEFLIAINRYLLLANRSERPYRLKDSLHRTNLFVLLVTESTEITKFHIIYYGLYFC